MEPNRKTCCGGQADCDDSSRLDRRGFLELVSLGGAALGAVALDLPAMAGPFEAKDFEKTDPGRQEAASRLGQIALRPRQPHGLSRRARWKRSGCRSAGFCAGQLYLGGDGRLWHWDIFNQQIGTGDGHYAHPPRPESPLDQGFAIRIGEGPQAVVKRLDRRASATSRSAASIRSDCRIPRSECAGRRFARSVFAVHSARSGQFEFPRHGDAIHREEHQQTRRSNANSAAICKTPFVCSASRRSSRRMRQNRVTQRVAGGDPARRQRRAAGESSPRPEPADRVRRFRRDETSLPGKSRAKRSARARAVARPRPSSISPAFRASRWPTRGPAPTHRTAS